MGLSTREAYGKALVKLGKYHEFFVLDADLAKATNTIQFKKKFPNRFFDIGISEGDMIGTAAGMATCGKKVFASSFAMFVAGRAYEQIRNSVAYPNLSVVVAATHGGVLIGEDGASHQCIEDVSLMRTIPNMTVIVPCDEISVYNAVKSSVNCDGPVYIRMGKSPVEDIYSKHTQFEIGKGNVLNEGEDITIIAMGDMVTEALKANDILKNIGICATVIDIYSIKPIDKELILKCAEKTNIIITVEDHSIIGGLGSTVAEILCEKRNTILRRIGLNDTFGRSGSKIDLMNYYGLNAENIVKVACELKEKYK